MVRKINLQVRQMGGQLQLLDRTPGAESPFYKPDDFTEKLEQYAKDHADAAITITMSRGIYEGSIMEIREAMKKYRNVSFG